MWESNSKLNKALGEFLSGAFPLSAKCCSNPQIHVFAYDFGEEGKVGSAWVWCSNCKSYEHAGRMVLPKGWENCSELDAEQICVEPDYLEDNKSIIDLFMSKYI